MDRRLLTRELERLGVVRAEVEALRAEGGRAREGLDNDLVGIVFVIRAALLSGGLPEAEKEELEASERTARMLLREILSLRPTEGSRPEHG